MDKVVEDVARRLPYLKRVFLERDRLRDERDHLKGLSPFVPPGHYYSPIPSIWEVANREDRLFNNVPREVTGVDLDDAGQVALFEAFRPLFADIPFRPEKSGSLRYYYENPMFGYTDATFLHCLIRHLKPARIIEVGSGYSSCVILDTNERFFGDSIDCTFIEPYPETFLSLLRDGDAGRVKLKADRLEDVPLETFAGLSAGDILFIDSTHVSKIGSDVNYIFFEILPRLQSGVFVHFHDIFHPFEYPRAWVLGGRAWNEAYLLRAFLQYNDAFRVRLFSDYLGRYHRGLFEEYLPCCLKDLGGSLWIERR